MAELPKSNSLERQDVNDVTVLRVQVPLLLSDETTEELFERLFSFVENSGRDKLVLNVGAIQALASAALGKLVTLYRKSAAKKVRVVMCDVTPSVARILQITRLADVLIAYDSEGEALASFG
jgi:anti-sigma B factor antagonist